MKNQDIKNFYTEICNTLEGNYKIIIEKKLNIDENWIEYDSVKWELEEPLEDIVKELIKAKDLCLEEKIIKLYEYICLNYIYDDNVLYFFKRETTDDNSTKYIAIDWYGRIIDERWTINRLKHNKRVCYEFARFFAKAINELIQDTTISEAVMVGDKENLHYFVGLISNKYSILLDLDDFNKIKDLTRLKLGLTIDGITIIRDKNKKFENILKKYNDNKKTELQDVKNLKKNEDIIEYFKDIITIIKKYNIDTQGFMEYMRNIIEKEGIETEIIWKEVKDELEKRYSRCFYFEYKNKTYLLDSVDKTLFETCINNLDNNIFILNPEENYYLYYGG